MGFWTRGLRAAAGGLTDVSGSDATGDASSDEELDSGSMRRRFGGGRGFGRLPLPPVIPLVWGKQQHEWRRHERLTLHQ
eukprot:4991901-Pleurochrysis_carterae.AAC.1